MTRRERAQRVSHASGAGSDAGARPSTIARDAPSIVEGRERASAGDRGGEALRIKR
jgi:hypothetical protein